MPERVTSVSVHEVVALAITLHRQGRAEEAEQFYRRILEDHPNHVDALHYMGVLQHQRGNTAEARQLITQSLKLDPNNAAARINLGNLLKEQGEFAQAELEYRVALRICPDDPDAHNNLGAVLRAQGKLDPAIEAYLRATELNANHVNSQHNLGNALVAADRIQDALTAYRRALEIDPTHTSAHLSLGRALYRFGRLDEAITVFSKWLEVEPDQPIARHMLAACRGESMPEGCSEAFVRESFDAFAASFDEVLHRLGYRAPELVVHAIEQVIPESTASLQVLDAGCGTGLCGPHLRAYAKRLVGIDLAPKMVERARSIDQYDELQVDEITRYMIAHPDSFDLIVSADTLIYFGRLDQVLAAAARALRPNGWLVFTLELESDSELEDGFCLNPHGRYSHTKDYVRKQLGHTKFEEGAITEEILRTEIQEPVEGMIVTARRLPAD